MESPTPRVLTLQSAGAASEMFTARVILHQGKEYDCHVDYVHTHASIPKAILLRRTSRDGHPGSSAKATKILVASCFRVTSHDDVVRHNSLVVHYEDADGRKRQAIIKRWPREKQAFVMIMWQDLHDATRAYKGAHKIHTPNGSTPTSASRASRLGLVPDDIRSRERQRHKSILVAPKSMSASKSRLTSMRTLSSSPAPMPTGQSRRMRASASLDAPSSRRRTLTYESGSFSAKLIGRPAALDSLGGLGTRSNARTPAKGRMAGMKPRGGIQKDRRKSAPPTASTPRRVLPVLSPSEPKRKSLASLVSSSFDRHTDFVAGKGTRTSSDLKKRPSAPTTSYGHDASESAKKRRAGSHTPTQESGSTRPRPDSRSLAKCRGVSETTSPSSVHAATRLRSIRPPTVPHPASRFRSSPAVPLPSEDTANKNGVREACLREDVKKDATTRSLDPTKSELNNTAVSKGPTPNQSSAKPAGTEENCAQTNPGRSSASKVSNVSTPSAPLVEENKSHGSPNEATSTESDNLTSSADETSSTMAKLGVSVEMSPSKGKAEARESKSESSTDEGSMRKFDDDLSELDEPGGSGQLGEDSFKINQDIFDGHGPLAPVVILENGQVGPVPHNYVAADDEFNDLLNGSNGSPESLGCVSPSRYTTQHSIGIYNTGNTCYLASCLQMFLHDHIFLHELRYRLGTLGGPRFAKESPLSTALLDLAENQRHGRALNPDSVREAISTYVPEFAGFAQQDAQEFLSYALPAMQGELKAPLKECPVTRNFASVTNHFTTCKKCGKRSDGVSPELSYFFMLKFPETRRTGADGLPVPIKIDELVERQFGVEEVEYKCEQCDGKCGLRESRLAVAPRRLILHLNRVQYNPGEIPSQEKISDPVDIPWHLELPAPGYQELTLLEELITSSVTSPSSECETLEKVETAEKGDPGAEENKEQSCAKEDKEQTCAKDEKEEACAKVIASPKRPRSSTTQEADGDTVMEGSVGGGDCGGEKTDSDGAHTESDVEMKDEASGSSLEAEEEEGPDEEEEKGPDAAAEFLEWARKKMNEQEKSDKNADASSECSVRYKLQGVIRHLGDSVGFGHYVADMFQEESQSWVTYNDAAVYDTTKFDLSNMERDAYMLYYVRDYQLKAKGSDSTTT